MMTISEAIWTKPDSSVVLVVYAIDPSSATSTPATSEFGAESPDAIGVSVPLTSFETVLVAPSATYTVFPSTAMPNGASTSVLRVRLKPDFFPLASPDPLAVAIGAAATPSATVAAQVRTRRFLKVMQTPRVG